MGDIYKKYRRAYESVGNPSKDGYNPHFKNTYASLGNTLAAVRPACREAGIVYQQKLVCVFIGESYIHLLRSCVVDDDGDSIELSEFPVDNSGNAQAFGSEMTYKRRQQAQADWGITGEDDDDAEVATGQPVLPAGSYTKAKIDRFAKITQLKENGISLGIANADMARLISELLGGRQLREATDEEIAACESALGNMIQEVTNGD